MGADLPTMLFALLDGVIAVAGTLWFLAWLRGRWPAHGMRLGKAARASYATYFIHPLVLTAIMVLFASVALVPEIKFVLVAAAGVAACIVSAPICIRNGAGSSGSAEAGELAVAVTVSAASTPPA